MKTVEFADPVLQKGFTQIPNVVLRNPELSVAARLTYAMLQSFAWESEKCWTGRAKLAWLVGVSERSLYDYLSELKEARLLKIIKRGQGKTDLYRLLAREHAWQPASTQVSQSTAA